MNTKFEEFCLLFAAGEHLAGTGTVKEQLAELEEAVENNLDWEGVAYYPYEYLEPSMLLGEIYDTYTTLASSLNSSGLLKEQSDGN